MRVTVTAAIAVRRNCAARDIDSKVSRSDLRITLSGAVFPDGDLAPGLGFPVVESMPSRSIEDLGERTRAGDIRRTGPH